MKRQVGRWLSATVKAIAVLTLASLITSASSTADGAAPDSPAFVETSKFHSEDVQVGNAPFELPGVLTIPTSGNGPWPAVVLLGGSGPNDRDETTGPNHVFKDIAEGLSSGGIVVLRYDKRTLVYGKKMNLHQITIKEEYLDDAIVAINLLRSRKEVDGDRIFVAGHSLGATIAPEVALKAAPVQGLILLAPSGRQFGESVVQQMRFLEEASHQQLDEIERRANELDKHQMPATENFMGMPA
jgi:poly(3-hydroxybutyrate) depolymerase